MYARFFKRIIDFTIALAALMVLFPVLLALAIIGAIVMKGNPLFVQSRPGKKDKHGNEKIFKLIKFRTMSNAKDKNGELLPDELRLNKYGRFLRSTSLDEIPELLNILKGDMSIVGPRPLLVRYIPRYTDEQRRRHDVRPGLTGLAQVNGRNAISWEERFAFDVEYVDNISLLGDIRIIIGTIKAVLKRSGIGSGTSETMEEFMGNDEKKVRKNKKVVIIGAGGHGRVIANIVKLNGDEVVGYLDDRKTGEFNGCDILGTSDDIGLNDRFYFAAIGDNEVRQRIMGADAMWYTAIHPSAVIAEDAQISEGVAIMANAVINPGSKIGRGAIINTSATVDHDNVIKDYAHIGPGAHLAGTVIIGERTFVCIGANIINNIDICDDAIIGSGAVVLNSIKEKGTYAGVPAKKLN